MYLLKYMIIIYIYLIYIIWAFDKWAEQTAAQGKRGCSETLFEGKKILAVWLG